MRRKSPCILCFLALIGCTAIHATALGQGSVYPAAGQFDGNVVPAGGAHMAPPLPASPLAGGMPASQGTAFVDAHGQSVVMPASYCPPGYGGGGMAAGGAFGDPMAVDFGGYASEQCGPHYFDVSFGTVFLQDENSFGGLGPFTQLGLNPNVRAIDPANDFGEYEPGWEVAIRYDIGPLAVFEATYMGLYDIGFFDSITAEQLANASGLDPNQSLNSVFSELGGIYGAGDLIPGIDQAEMHSFEYEADLQSTELSYRRYWVGNHPGISGTWLLGARYFRYTDVARFSADGVVDTQVPDATDPNNLINAQSTAGRLNWDSSNDMVGFQFGGDAWMCLRQGLRIGGEGLAGIYNNRYEFRSNGEFDYVQTGGIGPQQTGTEPIFTTVEDGNQVAFAAEADVAIVADILPSWSIRGGYRVLFLNSLVTASNNIRQGDLDTNVVWTQESLLFHGFHGGMEYVW